MSVFGEWSAVVAYARTKWSVADDGRSIDRTWPRADRSQFVSIAPFEHEGLTWLVWSSSIGDDSDVKDARILDLAATEPIGRIVRRDGNIWLEQCVPLATVTPSLLDWISESFAARADNLEQRISGRDDA